MKKYQLPKKNFSSGYTIIEILVSILILIIIFSVTSANLRGYQQTKNLDQAEKQVRSDLKLAKDYALNGKIISGCVALNGYTFSASSANSSYTIRADCLSDVDLTNKVQVKLPEGIKFSNNRIVLFKVFGKGAVNLSGGGAETVFTLVQDTTGDLREIKVKISGLID